MVEVEVVSPVKVTLGASGPTAKPRESDNAESVKKIDADSTFRFGVFIVLLVQAVLIIWGYLDLAAYYETFGIRIGELDIGVPLFLAFGYVYSFSALMELTYPASIIGGLLPALVFMGLGLFIAFAYYRIQTTKKSGGVVPWQLQGLHAGAVLMLVFFAPLLAVHSGLNRAKEDFKIYTGQDAKFGLSKEQIIVTDGSTLTGHIVVADLRSTFLLVDKVLYKIDNSSNRVMRKTELSPKEKPSAENHPSKPD